MDQIRKRTRRKAPVDTRELIAQINPVIRGWGLYFCKANIRKLFARLDRWILRRIWSHRFKRWRCRGWRHLCDTCRRQPRVKRQVVGGKARPGLVVRSDWN
jgi:hypothetical protein